MTIFPPTAQELNRQQRQGEINFNQNQALRELQTRLQIARMEQAVERDRIEEQGRQFDEGLADQGIARRNSRLDNIRNSGQQRLSQQMANNQQRMAQSRQNRQQGFYSPENQADMVADAKADVVSTERNLSPGDERVARSRLAALRNSFGQTGAGSIPAGRPHEGGFSQGMDDLFTREVAQRLQDRARRSKRATQTLSGGGGGARPSQRSARSGGGARRSAVGARDQASIEDLASQLVMEEEEENNRRNGGGYFGNVAGNAVNNLLF